MKRKAFEYLYIHANCLAELGLAQSALSPDGDMAGSGDELAHLSADEREALALDRMSKMDMASMMDGSIWETPEHDAEVKGALQQLQEEAAEGASSPAPPPPVPADYLPDDPLAGVVPAETNLVSHLEKAYASSDKIAARVDAGLAQVEMARLEGLLCALPVDLAALTGALGADDLAQWLACYHSGHAALFELVTLIRGLAGERW